MRYTPEQAGDLAVYLWVVSGPDGKRELLPDSPFRVLCNAGPAHAAGSRMDGFSTEEVVLEKGQSKKGDSKGQKGGLGASVNVVEVKGSRVGAGLQLLFKPSICDLYGNPTAVEEGALQVSVVLPDGDVVEIEVDIAHGRAGRGRGDVAYEARYEPQAQGASCAGDERSVLRSHLICCVLCGVHASLLSDAMRTPPLTEDLYDHAL